MFCILVLVSNYSQLSSMHSKKARTSLSVVKGTLFSTTGIYVMGGFGTSVDSNVELYTGLWKPAPLMSVKRYGHAAVVYDDHIYVIGGAKVYKDYVAAAPPMASARSHCSALVYSPRIGK